MINSFDRLTEGRWWIGGKNKKFPLSQWADRQSGTIERELRKRQFVWNMNFNQSKASNILEQIR